MSKLSSSFKALNIAQCLGALNDNAFKILIIFSLIQIQGKQCSSNIAALTGTVFVVPFLLFSIFAGTLADHISKRKIIITMKSLELFIMLVGLIAFAIKNEYLIYTVLFLMSTQSAFFGPSKYGIIPELVDKISIVHANSIITMFTYIAVIIGTFLASFIADITNKNFIVAAIFCVIIALIGLISSLRIQEVSTKAYSHKKISPFSFLDAYHILKDGLKVKNLVPSIFCIAYFLFIGSFLQLIIVPYSIECLSLNDIYGGYLFLMTALGIGLGSFIVGKIFNTSKPKLEIVPIGSLGITIGCLILQLFSSNIYIIIPTLFVIGIFGGIFLIPLESYIQFASSSKNRAQNIAVSSFFGFLGVLCASGLIFFSSSILKLKPNESFSSIVIATLLLTMFITWKFRSLRE